MISKLRTLEGMTSVQTVIEFALGDVNFDDMTGQTIDSDIAAAAR